MQAYTRPHVSPVVLQKACMYLIAFYQIKIVRSKGKEERKGCSCANLYKLLFSCYTARRREREREQVVNPLIIPTRATSSPPLSTLDRYLFNPEESLRSSSNHGHWWHNRILFFPCKIIQESTRRHGFSEKSLNFFCILSRNYVCKAIYSC
jgi:hypothetical protein